MHLLARTLRHLANRYLADPDRFSQQTARANAATAHARLRRRRREQDDVEAYVRAQLTAHRGADESRRQAAAASRAR
jgi:hypothetical protein